MKTLIIYRSYGGSTRAYAKEEAAKREADLYEVREKRKFSQARAFLTCPLAIRRAKASLAEPIPDMSAYDRIVVAVPVWAGYPVPPFNNIIAAMPKGKEVEVVLLSGGGETPKSKAGTIKMIEKAGLKLISYTDIKTDVGIDISQQE